MDLATLINILTFIALMAIMGSIGLKVSLGEVIDAIRQTRLMLLCILTNFLFVPLIAVFLLFLLDTTPLVSAGFLVLAVCPGAPVGPSFTAIARGSVVMATGAMVILAALSALISPLLLALLMGWISSQSDLQIDSFEIVKILLFTQILPLASGICLHHWTPALTRWITKPLGSLANLMLLIVVALILATQYQTLGAIKGQGWVGMLVLMVASLVTGWICGGNNPSTRRAFMVTAGLRNAAVALVIVSANFAGTPAVTAVIAYALVSTFGTFCCAILLGKDRQQEPAEAST